MTTNETAFGQPFSRPPTRLTYRMQRQSVETQTEVQLIERSVRPVALVWRKREPAVAGDEAAGPTHIAFAKPLQPVSIAQTTAESPAITATGARDIAGIKAFDAATVDRLAEDVMQRVDKRLRIERERRGI